MPCLQPDRGDSAQMLLFKIASCVSSGPGGGGVTSFNGLSGVVTFTGADIITLLGCTPACEGDVVNSFNTRIGDVTLTLADVSTVADARYVLKAGDTMTGALVHPVGSAAAPSITFTGDLDTGFFRSSANELAFSAGGVQKAILSTTELTLNPGVGFNLSGAVLSIFGGAQLNVDADTILSSANGIHVFTQTGEIGFFAASPVLQQSASTAEGVHLALQNYGLLDATAFQRTSQLAYVAKTATYTISATTDYTVDCTANTFTVNLPTAAGITGQIFVVKNSGVGTITLDPSGAELIDSLATATIVSGASITTQSTGTGWIII